MPAPTVATYSAAALVGAHTFFKGLIDAGGVAGSIKIRSATDVLLAQVPLAYPCGTVNATTGQLVLSIAGPDASADAAGTAAYAEVCSSTGTVHLALPALAGAAAVPGAIVLNSVVIVLGEPVQILTATLG